MVTKQQETDNRVVFWVVIIALIIFGYLFIRIAMFSSVIIERDDVCNIELGENWKYEYDDLFGRTCVEVDYISLEIINRMPFNWTNKELLNKYCPDRNKFWDLSKWSDGCEDWRDLIG